MAGIQVKNDLEFFGFAREVGRAGTRNLTLVLSVTGLTGPSARWVGTQLRGAVVIGTDYGSGHLGADGRQQERALKGFACHPNVGAVLVIGADELKIEPVVAAAQAAGRRVEGLCLDDFGHDALRLRDAALRSAATMIKELSAQERNVLPMSELAVGLECGRSDPSSGLVANPLVGRAADAIVDAGGVAMIGETIEWLGAEDALAERAATSALGDAIRDAVLRREQMATRSGLDLTYNNPSLTNINAGLTTIEEKSLGAVAKSGSKTVQGLLEYGEAPPSAGLFVMDAPAYAPESLTGFAAAGCSLALFTTGVGNSYGSALMPTIKITANPNTAAALSQQLDFTAHGVIDGRESLVGAARALLEQIARTASGQLTWAEVLGDNGEIISRVGGSL